MTWIGEPLERASSAAEPAVEPTSIAPARRASLALFEPADWIQLTVTSSPTASSIQPWSLMIEAQRVVGREVDVEAVGAPAVGRRASALGRRACPRRRRSR